MLFVHQPASELADKLASKLSYKARRSPPELGTEGAAWLGGGVALTLSEDKLTELNNIAS
jgi:hypothetical protein